ncbi:helix-turn-helix transcriptional regulator [Rothia sp. (in: high G+C Gram-positive bacteria)]|uniref:helix-turn-helix domain-containing protein n=1 Tax=Rothia sp. (in: high G+C Gram-positive bacteria) TaxID=1885016 RepID=UPI000ED15348|nr:hypothetical protein [Rothia sp. (in: high G+C Gram-positive bacteria)]
MGQRKQDEPSEFTLAVHAEIRGWMGKRNMSQRQLSEASGITRSTLSRIIGTNVQAADLNELESLCAALGVSPEMVVDDAARSLEQSSYGLAAKHDPGVGADINDEDYF